MSSSCFCLPEDVDKEGAVTGGCNGTEWLQAERNALRGSGACSPQHVVSHGPRQSHHQGSPGELVDASLLLCSSLWTGEQDCHIVLDLQPLAARAGFSLMCCRG